MDNKKKLLLINSVCGIGSTGRLCVDIANAYNKDGYTVRIAYGRRAYVPEDCYGYAVRIGSTLDVYAHVLATRLTDRHGLFSKRATKQFLEWADEFDPDIVWLHNIHGYYINYEMLFDWIKSRPQMSVRWTLHDCWSFTGHCAYFTYAGCDKWEPAVSSGTVTERSGKYIHDLSGCDMCPQSKSYPGAWFTDRSRENYLSKQKAFTGVANLSIITPSVWLKNLVQKSFLGDYPVQVVYNQIDSKVFKPTESDFRSDHGISKDTYMILAVANVWEKRKGLEDIIELHRRLSKAKLENRVASEAITETGKAGKRHKLVIVGLTPKQIKNLPSGILGMGHTTRAKDLAAIYTAADVVINPTYEDNYPSVILESEACGTPVITYDTGGCSEAIHISGSKVIEPGIDNLEKEILRRINS